MSLLAAPVTCPRNLCGRSKAAVCYSHIGILTVDTFLLNYIFDVNDHYVEVFSSIVKFKTGTFTLIQFHLYVLNHS